MNEAYVKSHSLVQSELVSELKLVFTLMKVESAKMVKYSSGPPSHRGRSLTAASQSLLCVPAQLASQWRHCSWDR